MELRDAEVPVINKNNKGISQDSGIRAARGECRVLSAYDTKSGLILDEAVRWASVFGVLEMAASGVHAFVSSPAWEHTLQWGKALSYMLPRWDLINTA